jgi:hypothetical protein
MRGRAQDCVPYHPFAFGRLSEMRTHF